MWGRIRQVVGQAFHDIVQVRRWAFDVQLWGLIEEVVFLAQFLECFADALKEVRTAVEELRHCLGLFVNPELEYQYFRSLGSELVRFCRAKEISLLILGSITRLTFPFSVFSFSRRIRYSTVKAFFSLRYSRLSDTRKNSHITGSPFKSGTVSILLRNVSIIIIRRRRCLSVNFLYELLFAIGGIGRPGCNFSRVSLNQTKSL